MDAVAQAEYFPRPPRINAFLTAEARDDFMQHVNRDTVSDKLGDLEYTSISCRLVNRGVAH